MIRRSTFASVAIIFVLAAFAVWQMIDHAWLSIHVALAEEQTEIFEAMTVQAEEALAKSPPDVKAAVASLTYAHGYYPSGTKQTKGSRLDKIVERTRSLAEFRMIQMLQEVTGNKLDNDVEAWIDIYQDDPTDSH